MLKNTLLIASLFVTGVVTAQITITSGDMPNAGDSILVSITNTVGASTPSLTGAGYNWDYSALTPNSQRHEKFDSPFTFTSPFNLIFNFLNTTYGKINYNFTAIPAVPITSAYDFYKVSSSQLKQTGSGYTVSGTPLPFLYTSDDIVYNFPMNYLNSDSCDYKYGLPIPTIGYYGETGHRVNHVDGWGTVTTPFGSFSALRVFSTISSVDTLYLSTLGFGTNIARPLKYEYKWLAAGKKIPVLEIDENDVAGTMTITNVEYQDSVRSLTGIAENNASNFNAVIYPNPVINDMLLQYNLSANTHVKISITNVLGKTTAVIVDATQTNGMHLESINTDDYHLNSGIYFLNIETNNCREVKKIVVSK